MFHSTTAFIAPGGGELLVIMLVFILLFGAKDAPRILRSAQAFFDRLQRASADFRYKMMHSDLCSPEKDENQDDEKPDGSGECQAGCQELSPPENHEKSVS